MIIAFNVEFGNEEASAEIIRAFQHQGCPLLLTAKSVIIAKNNITKIHEVLGSHINPLFHEENTFASFRPCRNDESDSVFYSNQYLIFYQNLNYSNNNIGNLQQQ